MSVSPTTIYFGGVAAGESLKRKLAITNNGTGDLLIVAEGLEATDFSIDGKASVTVKPKRTVKVSVVFSPTSPGPKAALLKISSNDPEKQLVDVPLTGTSGPAQ